MGCDRNESRAAASRDNDVRCAVLAQSIDRRSRRHRGDARSIARDLRAQQFRVLAGREPDDLEAIGMGVDNGQRVLTDGAGGSQNGYSLHGWKKLSTTLCPPRPPWWRVSNIFQHQIVNGRR